MISDTKMQQAKLRGETSLFFLLGWCSEEQVFVGDGRRRKECGRYVAWIIRPEGRT